MTPKVFQRVWQRVLRAHPLTRGMASYSILLPAANFAQLYITPEKQSTDLITTTRYTAYGAFYAAPLLHGWVKLTTAMWPKMNFRNGLLKAIVEIISFRPLSMASFFFIMTLMEMRPLKDAIKEVKLKFYPTYKKGIIFWPLVQTINFSLIPEQHRIVFVSVCSFFWTIFLVYMKSK